MITRENIKFDLNTLPWKRPIPTFQRIVYVRANYQIEDYRNCLTLPFHGKNYKVKRYNREQKTRVVAK